MRLRNRRDGNHADIVRELRKAGRRVLDLSRVGGGCADLLVGWGGGMVLMEVKDGSKPPSARELREGQEEFRRLWVGHVVTVTSVAEALAATGVRGRLSA